MAEEEEGDFCLESYNYFFRPDILKGKVAFITGGGSGIGFRIAEVFMRHECDTVIASRNLPRNQRAAERLERCSGQKCLPLQMDIRNPAQVMAGVDKALEKFSNIDILVNCSAGNFLCPASGLSYNAFRTVIDIDTVGTFNVTKTLFDKCFKKHGGSVINISATLQYTGFPLQCHAGSAKAAIDALTRHLCVEWGEYGIRVNTLSPGPIKDTEGYRRLGGKLLQETAFAKSIPLQRCGSSREIADAAVYLASGASSFVSGACLVVDGGSWLTARRSMDKVKDMMSKL